MNRINRKFPQPLSVFGQNSEGGALLKVKTNSDDALAKSAEQNVPGIWARIYAPTPVVNADQMRDVGIGMVERLYIPVPQEPRSVGDKIGNWLSKGEFA